MDRRRSHLGYHSELRYVQRQRSHMTTKNRFGAEDIGYHLIKEEKSKQATKITIITDSTGVPLSLDTCSASCSDVSRLIHSVDNLPQ